MAYVLSTKDNFYNEELAYDVMGNIVSLRRTHGSAGYSTNFKYTYLGNQLTKVVDGVNSARNNTFGYDGNGNGISNSRLGITSIQYNYLNLPNKFTKGSENLLYTYNATGVKLTKTLGTNETQYVGGIQYKNGVLEFIQTEEGFAGMGNSITAGLGVGPATIGGTYGGTQGNSFSDFGSMTSTNSRPYKTYGGGQSSQYPGISVGGKVSVGSTIDATRTWILKF